MFTIVLSTHAQKFLKNAETELYGRLIKKIRALETEPFPSDAKRIVNREEKIFRVRVGKYRIQYVVFHDKKEIFISDIDIREHAYEA